MQTICTRELVSILDTLYKDTVLNYLQNYKFNKYRTTFYNGINARYKLNDNFLSLLYTTLFYRNREKEGIKLKNHFKDYKIKILKWEEFVK